MATGQKDSDIQEERVAKALATMSVAEIRKLVSEMEAELRKPVLTVVGASGR
jgi:hypothetical protein